MIKYCNIHNVDELIKLCNIIIESEPHIDNGNIIGFPINICGQEGITHTGLYSKYANRYTMDNGKIVEIDIYNYHRFKNSPWFDKGIADYINKQINTK